MQLRAKGRWIEGAIASMLQSNRAAADCFRQYQATACTDVSGFGLVGHLLEMIQSSPIENPIGDQVTSQVKSQVKFQVGVNLSLSTIPVLFGTHTTIEQGLFSSLYSENLNAERFVASALDSHSQIIYPLLFDPQTSGGLLASVPPKWASACLSQLQEMGYKNSAIIGQVTKGGSDRPIVLSEVNR
ncbi:MAG: hypothetical protein F6K16_30405 [Symploca sp. SIO2B6]|nr:hypothetical protein [Symploca sp. SIO2B6]